MLWKEKYNIGVKHIDEQHKELFRRVECLVNEVKEEGPWGTKVLKLNKTFCFMKDYVCVHFKDEEDYQEEIGYPGLEEHRNMHASLINSITDLENQYFEQGFKEELMHQLTGYLLSWLVRHVTVADQKIAEYEKGLGKI